MAAEQEQLVGLGIRHEHDLAQGGLHGSGTEPAREAVVNGLDA